MNNDLTVGKPEKVLVRFAVPLFGSVIFQQLYNIADSFVAGHYCGENALAAVGNSYEITLIYIAFAFGCNVGCSVVVSRLFGAGRYGQVRSAVSTTAIASAILCLLLMIVSFLGAEPLLRLIQTPDILMADSLLYLRIYIAGLMFLFFYNIATGIFAALGDSLTPFIFLAISSVANVLADIWFVRDLNMGVAGVAWATFICQGISCIASVLVVIRKMMKLPGMEEKFRIFSGKLFREIVVVAIPSTLQQSFVSVGNIIIQSAINGFGPSVIAGYAASIKLNNLVITSLGAIGNAMSNYVGQNMGAGRKERLKPGYVSGIVLSYAICCAPACLIYLVFGSQLVNWFMDNPTKEAVETGYMFLKIVAPFYFCISLKLVSDGVLRGMAKMNLFMISTFTDLVLRVGLALIFSRFMGATGIWCAWPVGWLIGTVVSMVFCCRLIGKQGKRVKGE